MVHAVLLKSNAFHCGTVAVDHYVLAGKWFHSCCSDTDHATTGDKPLTISFPNITQTSTNFFFFFFWSYKLRAHIHKWTKSFTPTWPHNKFVCNLPANPSFLSQTYLSQYSHVPLRNSLIRRRCIQQKCENRIFLERTSTIPLFPHQTTLGRSAKRPRTPPRQCGVKLLLPTASQRERSAGRWGGGEVGVRVLQIKSLSHYMI